MNAPAAELQQRIETASALKRLFVSRCLDQISVAEFHRARAEIIGRRRDHEPAERTRGPVGTASPTQTLLSPPP